MKHKGRIFENMAKGYIIEYMCNGAVKIKLEKMTTEWDKVNCKNCLKQQYVV